MARDRAICYFVTVPASTDTDGSADSAGQAARQLEMRHNLTLFSGVEATIILQSDIR